MTTIPLRPTWWLRGRRGFAVLSYAALAACSSGGARQTPTSADSRPTSLAPAPSGRGSPADAATRMAVTQAYTTFFSSKATVAQSQAALQHGALFTATLRTEANSPNAQDSGVTVSSVRLVSPKVAAVTFTITNKGAPLLAGLAGHAVQTDGKWQVAAETFCNLVGLEGTAPPACSDPKITALTG